MQRGPLFVAGMIDACTREPDALLVRLAERVTRIPLRPGAELSQIRAAALLRRHVNLAEVNVEVARILAHRQKMARAPQLIVQQRRNAGRRFIVSGSHSNPYFSMMYSQLHTVGFTVQYVDALRGVLDAIREAEQHGEAPHVHLDSWLSHEEASSLILSMTPATTLSVTAHDLERNVALQHRRSGMQVLLGRASAIHLLSASSIRRLRLSQAELGTRLFHVQHPAYYGAFGGAYQLPQEQAQARKRLGRDAEEFAVGLVGRISDRKRVELLLDAANLLNKEAAGISPPKIYISGSLRTRFAERIIRQAFALPNVTLMAEDLTDEAAGIQIASLSVAVVPYHEYLNSGWTLLALSAGLPIIASRESTASEVVPAEALITFDEGDARSLADAIHESSRRDPVAARAAALASAEAVHPDEIARQFAKEIAARVFAK